MKTIVVIEEEFSLSRRRFVQEEELGLKRRRKARVRMRYAFYDLQKHLEYVTTRFVVMFRYVLANRFEYFTPDEYVGRFDDHTRGRCRPLRVHEIIKHCLAYIAHFEHSIDHHAVHDAQYHELLFRVLILKELID